MTRSHGFPARRRWPRRAAAVVVALAMAAVFGLVLSQSWQQTTADQQQVSTQRDGLAYLSATVRLVDTLTAAQSAAVAGAAVDMAAARAAQDAVAAQDEAHGVALGTTQRWSDLRVRVGELLKNPGSGRTAYQRFADANALAIDLIDAVVAAANLLVDPAGDTYFLADTAARRLPEVMLYTGAAAGAIALADGQPAEGQQAVNLAVARNRVATAAAQIASNLRRGDRAAPNSSLSADLAAGQDTFQAAANAFAPPSVIIARVPDAAEASASASGVQPLLAAALSLATATIGALDDRAAAREQALTQRRNLLIATAGAAFVGAVVLLCLLAPSRRQAAYDPDDSAGEGPVLAVEPAALMDARDMLLEELVHVGRGVRARAREDADDAL